MQVNPDEATIEYLQNVLAEEGEELLLQEYVYEKILITAFSCAYYSYLRTRLRTKQTGDNRQQTKTYIPSNNTL